MEPAPARPRHEAIDRARLRRGWPGGHRGRRRTALSGMIVRFPPVPLGLVQGGDAQ